MKWLATFHLAIVCNVSAPFNAPLMVLDPHDIELSGDVTEKSQKAKKVFLRENDGKIYNNTVK